MQKISYLLLIFLLFSSALHASNIKNYTIHDKAEFKSETYYSEMYEENVTRNLFQNIGAPKTVSILKSSKAELIDCPKQVSTAMAKTYHQSESNDKFIELPNLTIQKCVKISYQGANVYIVQFFIGFDAVNATFTNNVHEPILWIGLEKENKIKEVFFKISGSRMFGESTKKLQLKTIADIDNDNQHDIVIDDIRYAGSGYIIFKYAEGSLSKSDMFGDAWD